LSAYLDPFIIHLTK